MNKKYIYIIIALFFIIISLITVIMYPWPEPNDDKGEQQKEWKNFSDTEQGISFQYPEKLGTKYIDAQTWPPKVEVKIAQFLCAEELIKINDQDYCVGLESGAAAGSMYNTYVYNTMKDERMVTVQFTLRFDQCGNYEDPNKTACEQEQKAFSVGDLVDQIVKTLKFDN